MRPHPARRVMAYGCAIAWCAAAVCPVRAGDDAIPAAAGHRVETARAQVAVADELLESAAAMRARDYLYEAERADNLKAAGEAALRAADALAAAADNFGRASALWASAGDAEASERARDEAATAGARAASSYEQAADDFEAGGDGRRASAARRNARRWREAAG